MIRKLWCAWFGHKKPYKISSDVDGLRYVWCTRCLHFIPHECVINGEQAAVSETTK